MNVLRYVLPAAAVLAIGLSVQSASADGFGVGNCSFGNFNAYGASGTLYGSGYLHVPPYYAIHPPVYYSHHYYRPYGWSPFAQSSWQGAAVLRPEPRPEVIINPHVREVEEARPAPAAARASPTGPTHVFSTRVSRREPRHPTMHA